MTNNKTQNEMNIQKEVKKIIKKDFIKKNEIKSIEIKGDSNFGMVKVVLTSTCGVGEFMTWEYTYSVREGNENVFSEYEKIKFPHLITKTEITVKSI